MKIEIISESMLGINGRNMVPGVHEFQEPISEALQFTLDSFLAKGLIKVVKDEAPKPAPKPAPKVEAKVEAKVEPKPTPKVEPKVEPKDNKNSNKKTG